MKSSEAVRAGLRHPVVDSDGHTLEIEPLFLEHLKSVGGARVVERYLAWRKQSPWHAATPGERADRRMPRPHFWFSPSKNTLDRATAMLPSLFRERMDSFGIDYAILYPTIGLFFVRHDDEELRGAACRALNTYHAEIYREHRARMTPAAMIPTHTPEEAIRELEYASRTLSLKVAMILGVLRRPIPVVARTMPTAAPYAYWMDPLALDSAYDYDPLWAKCLELKIAPTS